MNNKLRGKDLDKIGYNNNLSKSIAIAIASKHFNHTSKDEILNIYKKVQENPADYFNDAILSQLAYSFVEKVKEQNFKAYELRNQKEPYKVYGHHFIEDAYSIILKSTSGIMNLLLKKH